MKKFIKSKIDYNETTNCMSPTTPMDTNITCDTVKQEIQPPLPLYPRPPDPPPNINLALKKEIDDTDYQTPLGEESSDQLVDCKFNYGDIDKPRPMCRDYIRGKCLRAETCHYSHKCDLSQLVGVYTFCRNYQNAVCTHTNCKFVHATVFEEQEFYRTAVLPPNALAHHKNPVLPPPPPPPPEEPPPTVTSPFNLPPPPMHVRVTGPQIPITCIPAARAFADVRESILPGTSTQYEWPSTEYYSGSSHVLQSESEHSQKWCKHCKYGELREEVIKEQCEKGRKSNYEVIKQSELLKLKQQRLNSVLMNLFKPMYQANQASGSGVSLNPVDRQKRLLEQRSNTVNPNLLGLHEDPNKYNMKENSDLSGLAAKLLQVCKQHILSDQS